MLIKYCFSCKYHEIVHEEGNEISRCTRENCYSRFTKCISNKALEKFLEEQSKRDARPFSAIERFYPME